MAVMAETATAHTAPRKGKTAAKKKESFTLFAPDAESVFLLGDFTQWEETPIALKKQKSGAWKASVSLEPGSYEYRFKVDGQWRDDPDCPVHRPNAFGGENCVREVR